MVFMTGKIPNVELLEVAWNSIHVLKVSGLWQWFWECGRYLQYVAKTYTRDFFLLPTLSYSVFHLAITKPKQNQSSRCFNANPQQNKVTHEAEWVFNIMKTYK